ncbi:MAG TPA: tripartite tricarboxylate transporter permease, partial [Candidatus Binatia bacterium]|nr:tripartite tricarboxylate transporter permease [Candidatus Binatia bacterium]
WRSEERALPAVVKRSSPVSWKESRIRSAIFGWLYDVVLSAFILVFCQCWVLTWLQWISYAHAVQGIRDRAGKGAVEGVLGPGAANNSTRGGDLIPTVAFGIPGSGSMALLLGALLIVGLNPGPEMLKQHLDVTFAMVWVLIISSFIVAGLCFLVLNHLAALTFVRGSLLIPFLLFLVFIGSFTSNNDLNDIIATLIFGVVGYFMVRFGWPRPPLILGLTLGKIAENYLWISTAAYGAKWLAFPSVIILILITVFTVAYPTIKERMGKVKYERPEDAI